MYSSIKNIVTFRLCNSIFVSHFYYDVVELMSLMEY